jgi:O-antigen/teichoic acid export membrane protein
VASAVNIIGSLIMIQQFGYIGAVYSLLLMNITTQVIYSVLLKRAELAPNLFDYFKPFFLFIVAVGAYWIIGADSFLLALLLIGLYIGASWMLIKEIRESTHSIVKYVFRPKVPSESA